jgi:hypothetical protein
MKVDIKIIDENSAYSQKTEEVKIQYWRYQKSKFIEQSSNLAILCRQPEFNLLRDTLF